MGIEWYRRWRKARLVHHTCKSYIPANWYNPRHILGLWHIWALDRKQVFSGPKLVELQASRRMGVISTESCSTECFGSEGIARITAVALVSDESTSLSRVSNYVHVPVGLLIVLLRGDFPAKSRWLNYLYVFVNGL